MRASTVERIAIVVALNGFFVSEIIRKYFIGSQVVLIAYEALVVSIAIVFLHKVINKRITELILIFFTIVAWGLFVSIFASAPSATLVLGLRTYIFPISVLILGVRLFETMSKDQFNLKLLSFVVLWMLVIGTVAVLQITLGQSHFLTIGVGRDEAEGLGDWAYGSNLFRTTSLFQHTGKYGQIIFILAAASCYLRTSMGLSNLTSVSLLILEISSVILSGQRIGILLYFAILGALQFGNFRNAVVKGAYLAPIFIVSIFFVPSILSIFDRAITIFDEIPFRISANIIEPLAYAIDEFGFSGLGFGYVSFGSETFGGRLLFSVVTVGNPENSYLRMVVETGILGALLSIAFFMHPILVALTRVNLKTKQDMSLRAFTTSMVLAAMIWGNTHDTLGATATTGMLFFFLAPIYSRKPY
jgi:hypothetical protein